MNVQMMEGLLGASSNIKLSGTSMSVYRQASAEGDTDTPAGEIAAVPVETEPTVSFAA
ncbi:MAG: hypothetical protein HFF31_12675 [Flavonifractor sp.]|jgi:hypothetical protein|nr:hypothetical protein [Flavonifractor sp.]